MEDTYYNDIYYVYRNDSPAVVVMRRANYFFAILFVVVADTEPSPPATERTGPRAKSLNAYTGKGGMGRVTVRAIIGPFCALRSITSVSPLVLSTTAVGRIPDQHLYFGPAPIVFLLCYYSAGVSFKFLEITKHQTIVAMIFFYAKPP